jgi:hypothetical protein
MKAVIVFFLFVCFVARSENVRTQTVSLHTGWNSVYLEVDPTNAKPDVCFQGTPVSIVASYVGDGSAVQYVQNPTTNSVNKNHGWSVWYAPDRADAFLTGLFSLNANQAYLIFSQSDYVWPVTGKSVLSAVKWKPNSFNLAGFPLNEVSPPTFAQFFSPSTAHHPYRFYRLINSQWTLVDNAQTTQMHSGEAAWIYCTGGSDYQGPLDVKPQSGQQALISGVNSTGVLLANKTGNPLTVKIENFTSSAALPLAFVLRAVTESNVISASYDLPATYNAPVFEASESRGLWLTLRPEKMAGTTETTVLKITTDLGTECWLPVTGNRSELNSSN